MIPVLQKCTKMPSQTFEFILQYYDVHFHTGIVHFRRFFLSRGKNICTFWIINDQPFQNFQNFFYHYGRKKCRFRHSFMCKNFSSCGLGFWDQQCIKNRYIFKSRFSTLYIEIFCAIQPKNLQWCHINSKRHIMYSAQ